MDSNYRDNNPSLTKYMKEIVNRSPYPTEEEACLARRIKNDNYRQR